MTRRLTNAMRKFPDQYEPGCREPILEAAKNCRTVEAFRAEMQKLVDQGLITPRSQDFLIDGFDDQIRSPRFMIEGIARPGNPMEILIPIAKCDDLTLTEESLPEIFKRANTHTLNVQYPCINTSQKYDGRMVHRPNHNGTHSARQFRYVEVLFDLIEKKGTDEAKEQLHQFSPEEMLNLKLAAFFLRAGRVDESNFKQKPPDTYKERSAQVYRAYAEQLGVDPAIIDWAAALIHDSCRPIDICIEANKNPKSRFAYDLLTSAHEMDLVRCFRDVNRQKEDVFHHLESYVPSARNQVETLFDYSINLCQSTGIYVHCINRRANDRQFADCSLDGEHCYNVVKGQSIPQWV